MKKLPIIITFFCASCLSLSCQSSEENQFSLNEIIKMESIDELDISNKQKKEVYLALADHYNIDNNIQINNLDLSNEVLNNLDQWRKLVLSSYVQLKTKKVIEAINLNEKYDKRFKNARTNSEAAQIGEEFNQEVDSIMAAIEKEAKVW